MAHKPTGRRVGRPEKEDAFKPVSVKLPPDLLARVKQYAILHQQSLSELIRDGLEWRITEGETGYFRNTKSQQTPKPDTGNTVMLQEVKQLVERLSAVVGAFEAPLGQIIGEEQDVGNTVLQEHDHQEYNNTVIQKKGYQRHGSMREPILALLRSHPEGLTAIELKVHLRAEKSLGDTLQGMERAGILRGVGAREQKKYCVN